MYELLRESVSREEMTTPKKIYALSPEIYFWMFSSQYFKDKAMTFPPNDTQMSDLK